MCVNVCVFVCVCVCLCVFVCILAMETNAIELIMGVLGGDGVDWNLNGCHRVAA